MLPNKPYWLTHAGLQLSIQDSLGLLLLARTATVVILGGASPSLQTSCTGIRDNETAVIASRTRPTNTPSLITSKGRLRAVSWGHDASQTLSSQHNWPSLFSFPFIFTADFVFRVLWKIIVNSPILSMTLSSIHCVSNVCLLCWFPITKVNYLYIPFLCYNK